MPQSPILTARAVTRVARRAILCLTLLAAAAPALGAVPWHPDLDTARAAARVSQRPVLVVFTARWSRVAESLDATTFASPEAQAVLASGFEPVRIDVDAQPDLTRSLGITHVPTACILGPDNVPLASFEVSGSAPEFVAAVLQAVRQAATGTATAVATDARPGEPGSIAVVTDKVRQLTEFATAPGVPMSSAVATDAPGDPRLPTTPPAWPAEPATAPPTTAAAPPGTARPTLDPGRSTTSSWLGAAPAAPAPATSAPPAPTEPAAAPQSSFMAALQKPLSIFSRSAETADVPAADPPAPPPTMPPAKPQPPSFFGLVPSPAAEPKPNAQSAADPYGPMPVGLEGYCPVTLATKGTWAEGRAQWGVRHRGRTYLFVGAAEQQAFLADPDRYAPALSGDDPVLALDGGTSRPGQRRYGVTYQARTYLFASPETRSTFAADPSRYAARIVLAERAGTTRVY